MHPDPHPKTDEDRIDALWDRINGTQAERSTHLSQNSADTIDHAAISLLAAMVPPVEEDSLGRIRQKFEAGVEKETAVSTVTRGKPGTNVLPYRRPSSSSDPNRLRQFPRNLNWIAAAVLVMAVVGSAFVAGPGRNWLPERVEHQLAAIPGFETDKRPQQPTQGDRSLMGVVLEPGASKTGEIKVGLWRVILAPGTSFDIPESYRTLGKHSVDQFVESGQVTLGGEGTQKTSTEKQDAGFEKGAEYYRNDTTEPVVMLLLAPTDGGAFPFTINSNPGPSTPDASTTVSQATLLGTNTISAKDGFQIRVTVGTLHYAGMLDSGTSYGGTPAYVVIEQGEITVNRAANAGTPSSSTVFSAGESMQLGSADESTNTYAETGSASLSALLVTTKLTSDNPTLDQSTKAVAPYWTNWTIPEDGHISLAFRKITIQPGGSYVLPTDAGVSYSVVSGTVDLAVDGGERTGLQPGAVVGQNPGKELSFATTGIEPAVLMQSVVAAVGVNAFSAEISQDAAITTMVETDAQLPAGQASIMLRQHSYTGGNGTHSSSEGGPSISLVTAAKGIISVGRMGGEVSIATSSDSGDVKAPLGTSIKIGEGGYLFARPGSGWAMSGYGTEPSIGIALTVSPNDADVATPQSNEATPTVSGQTLVLQGKAVNCTIAPLSTDDVNRVMATPAATSSPLERSLKDQPGGHFDEATTEAITQLLQGYADCSASGNYPQMYAFYSDQAIRDSQTLRDLVEREWQVGQGPARASVEDIVLFVDGRAGARTVIAGEPAYLTFVKQNGEWKIDVWDDSGSGIDAIATPQS